MRGSPTIPVAAHLRVGSLHRPGGFSLVELLVALVVLQVGLLAVAGLVFTAQEQLTRAELLTRGELAVSRVADSLGGGLLQQAGSVPYLWGEVRWEAGSGSLGGARLLALSTEGDTLAEAVAWPPPPDSLFWWPDGRAPVEGGSR